ncbi:sialate O-acetylesterase [Parvularcula sp. LCG005]|uniref:sialate O-acetylesterase n=1 Tax=Parvularcula sp. LCG005 TaxID=3078805 RepID=UPI0029423DCD|nr:sialate O-acetylesterase [Parvularcula sp. LCG005]WOI52474.1 sialate O-acetylesterase [Parvularcula sp. LCG005]
MQRHSLLVSAIALCAATAAHAAPLSNVFGDHMVLQQGKPVTLWGHVEPGAEVVVRLAGDEKTVTADGDGAWSAEWPALSVGEAFMITATSGKETQTVSDVLAGDVWLCSGQSNMEFPVSRALNGGYEVGRPHDDQIRLIEVNMEYAPVPQDELVTPVPWAVASADTVKEFSAVCYFTARHLREANPDMPLGLIDSNWGGSQIEAWLSLDAMKAGGINPQGVDLLNIYGDDPAAAKAKFADIWLDWWAEKAPAGDQPWTDESEWSAAPDGLGDWKDWDDPELKDHLGMVWHRANLTLPDSYDGGDVAINVGGIDELDTIWVNGTYVGTTFGWGSERVYTVDGDLLKAGENTIVLNIYNSWGAGGITGTDNIGATLPSGNTVPLTDWSYKIAPKAYGAPPRAPWESISGLTSLYNTMLHPFRHFTMTGALWYQGESNAGRASEYEPLMSALVDDWQAHFGEDLITVIVQLPNFGPVPFGPVESGWAEVREAMRQVALNDDQTGIAVTIDVGDRYDIHPPNKQAVAKRVATSALALMDGDAAGGDGPQPVSVTQKKKQLTISFAPLNGDLRAAMSTPIGFEACAEGTCQIVPASIDKDSVVLTLPSAKPVDKVRYCWGEAPVCTLFDQGDTPITPFEVTVD